MRLDRRTALLGLGAAALGGASFAGEGTASSFDDPDDMYAALRAQPHQLVRVGDGTIRVVFADGAAGVARDPVLAWVRSAASAVTAYFGRFPVSDLGVLVIAESGDRVGHATTFGYAGSAMRIHVGRDATHDAFIRDWVLVHEMVHTALPNLPRRALWLQEGNATYVEPIARALIGQLSSMEVWRETIAGLPKGIAGADEGGMNGTQAWGRLYWGGATFWLLAEIAIFQDTAGKRSLRDALRHINSVSGGNSVTWSPEQLMSVGDKAIGTQSLLGLYTRFASSRVDTDLQALFKQLGVAQGADGTINFDDRAPLAGLRRRITSMRR